MAKMAPRLRPCMRSLAAKMANLAAKMAKMATSLPLRAKMATYSRCRLRPCMRSLISRMKSTPAWILCSERS